MVVPDCMKVWRRLKRKGIDADSSREGLPPQTPPALRCLGLVGFSSPVASPLALWSLRPLEHLVSSTPENMRVAWHEVLTKARAPSGKAGGYRYSSSRTAWSLGWVPWTGASVRQRKTSTSPNSYHRQ